MRVTSLSLTVVEAAAQRGGGAKLLDTALQQRHVDLPSLWSTHLRNKGRTGAPRSRLLLQAAAGGAHSVAERILHQLLRDAGIGGWKANHRVGGYRVDVGFPAQKVAIEVVLNADVTLTREGRRCTSCSGATMTVFGIPAGMSNLMRHGIFEDATGYSIALLSKYVV